MKRIIYLRPNTLQETFSLLEEYGCAVRLFTGGTDLIVRQQKGMLKADILIDTKHIQEIRTEIELSGRTLSIGARVILADLISHPLMRKHFPALVSAASTVGSVQIRNRATLTGNICNASPAADTVPPLIIYGASAVITGKTGSRRVGLKDFFLAPGKTVCSPEEIVTAIEIPLPLLPFGAGFERLTRRKGVDLATVNTACCIDAEGKTTFSFGAVGPTPVIVTEKNRKLGDLSVPESQRKALLENLTKQAKPISDVRAAADYRMAMLFYISWKALQTASAHYQEQKTEQGPTI